MNPYAIEGPAVISFSGGRSSGFMLSKILDAGIDDDVFIVFADTGRERDETYFFVNEVEDQWECDIHWVHRPGYFDQLIRDRRFLPHAGARFCTQELKLYPMRDFMLARGHSTWTNVVGLRADERRRVHKLRARNEPRWDVECPMFAAGHTLADVTEFWKTQPFDLELERYEGNCDLCFLKGMPTRVRIMVENRQLAQWWIDREDQVGATFQKGMSYTRLLRESDVQRKQISLPLLDAPDDLGDCFCTG